MCLVFNPVKKQRFINVNLLPYCLAIGHTTQFIFGKTNQGILTLKVWRIADDESLPIKKCKSHNTKFKLF